MSNRMLGRKPTTSWLILVMAPFIAMPFFNWLNSERSNMPHFFWYQFLWVVASTLLATLTYSKLAPRLQPVRRGRQDLDRE